MSITFHLISEVAFFGLVAAGVGLFSAHGDFRLCAFINILPLLLSFSSEISLTYVVPLSCNIVLSTRVFSCFQQYE